MSDLHFVLRHTLSGAVLTAGIVLGWIIVIGELKIGRIGADTVAIVVAASPIAGITIQGFHILMLWLLFKDPFNDPARTIVKKSIEKEIDDLSSPETSILEIYRDRIKKSPADAFFVWLYYSYAPSDMIDWARRRRSYYYLGWNFAYAA